MGRIISTKEQVNFWGKQADVTSSDVLEPQRNDLFLVDLRSAARQIAKYTNTALILLFPQYVRSVALPEIKIKAEQISRDSIPYHMPAADECLEPIKVNFVVDTWDGNDRSDVVQFLDLWMALVRAGRGSRNQGFNTNNQTGYFLLDSDFRASYRFNFYVDFIRGNVPLAAVDSITAAANTQSLSTQNMNAHTRWVIYRAWCAGYRVNELTHNESNLLLIEANFYADAVERLTQLPISGSPPAQNSAPG